MDLWEDAKFDFNWSPSGRSSLVSHHIFERDSLENSWKIFDNAQRRKLQTSFAVCPSLKQSIWTTKAEHWQRRVAKGTSKKKKTSHTRQWHLRKIDFLIYYIYACHHPLCNSFEVDDIELQLNDSRSDKPVARLLLPRRDRPDAAERDKLSMRDHILRHLGSQSRVTKDQDWCQESPW